MDELQRKRREFARRVRARRLEMKLSKRELGERLGWGGARVGKLERGKCGISLDGLRQLAKGLECRVGWLVGGEGREDVNAVDRRIDKSHSIDRGAYLPTAAQIRAACAKIQARWSPEEEKKRRVGFVDIPWEPTRCGAAVRRQASQQAGPAE